MDLCRGKKKSMDEYEAADVRGVRLFSLSGFSFRQLCKEKQFRVGKNLATSGLDCTLPGPFKAKTENKLKFLDEKRTKKRPARIV